MTVASTEATDGARVGSIDLAPTVEAGAPLAPLSVRPVPLELAWDAVDPAASSRGGLPDSLRARYGGDLFVALHPARPIVIANFVSTIDGVVAFDREGRTGGGEVSGYSEPDRFVMALLRALADVVIVGAGTVRAGGGEPWTPAGIHPETAVETAAWRAALGLAPHPTTVVLTRGGELDVSVPGLSAPDMPVMVLTTPAGSRRIAPQARAGLVVAETGSDVVDPSAVLDLVSAIGGRVALCEGGPHVLGEFVRARLVDELFLTLSPRLAGRDPRSPRLGLVEGSAFGPYDAPWLGLRSARRAGDHLFLRYARRTVMEEGAA